MGVFFISQALDTPISTPKYSQMSIDLNRLNWITKLKQGKYIRGFRDFVRLYQILILAETEGFEPSIHR